LGAELLKGEPACAAIGCDILSFSRRAHSEEIEFQFLAIYALRERRTMARTGKWIAALLTLAASQVRADLTWGSLTVSPLPLTLAILGSGDIAKIGNGDDDTIPEPATMVLLFLSATGLAGYVRRRRPC